MNALPKRLIFAALACVSTTAYGHVLWINVVPQAQEHVIVSLGYGDVLPGSELMSTDWGAMTVSFYELVAPDGTRSSLEPPQIVASPKKELSGRVSFQAAGDSGIRKLAFSAETAKGTYQVAAQTPVFQYTKYRDRAGAEHYSDRPPEKIKDVAAVLDRSFEVMYMKGVFSVGGWSTIKQVGQLFEIVPLTDLDAAKVGDVVRFKVLLDGRAWTPQNLSPQLIAHNAAFGDAWGVYIPLSYGEGSFRLTHGGLWKLNARFRAPIGSDERFQKLAPGAPKGAPIFFESTFVMNVKP